MPQMKGSFATYAFDSDATFPDDETAVEDAAQIMLNLCGNPGQEAMIGDLLEDFSDWALAILEEEGEHRGETWGDFAQFVTEEWYEGRVDKWQGTEEILWYGWRHIAEQSGFHDTIDEYGEGVGQQFG